MQKNGNTTIVCVKSDRICLGSGVSKAFGHLIITHNGETPKYTNNIWITLQDKDNINIKESDTQKTLLEITYDFKN